MKSLLVLAAVGIRLAANFAHAFDAAELYRSTIPTEKNLDAEWVESLSERAHALDRGIKVQRKMTAQLSVNCGSVPIRTLRLSPLDDDLTQVNVTYAGKDVAAGLVDNGDGFAVQFAKPVVISARKTLQLVLQ